MNVFQNVLHIFLVINWKIIFWESRPNVQYIKFNTYYSEQHRLFEVNALCLKMSAQKINDEDQKWLTSIVSVGLQHFVFINQTQHMLTLKILTNPWVQNSSSDKMKSERTNKKCVLQNCYYFGFKVEVKRTWMAEISLMKLKKNCFKFCYSWGFYHKFTNRLKAHILKNYSK